MEAGRGPVRFSDLRRSFLRSGCEVAVIPPARMRFLDGPGRGEAPLGLYCPDLNLIAISSAQDAKSMVETFVHEAIHLADGDMPEDRVEAACLDISSRLTESQKSFVNMLL